MEPRLYLAIYSDEHVTPMLARLLRARGYEAQSFLEAGMANAKDAAHFHYAVTHGFTLLTNNIDDFVLLAEDWIMQGRHHHGVILLPRQVGISELLRRCLILLDSLTADEAIDRILYLSNFG